MEFEKYIKVLRRPLILGLILLLGFSVSRLMLVMLFWDRASATGDLGFIFLQGVRFDLILLGMLIGPILMFRPFSHTNRLFLEIDRWTWPVYAAVLTALAFFVEASTTSFIGEYDSRPNYIFVEYLKYPKEVLSTLAGSHLAELILVNLAALLILWGVFKWARDDPAASVRVPLWLAIVMFPLVAIVVVMMIRSTLDHRPVNPSIAAFSSDSMVNQLPLNSPYSLLYAVYEHRRDSKGASTRYGEMAEQEVLEIILNDIGPGAGKLPGHSSPTMHRHEPTRQYERPLNIVIVLEESLGAQFVGSLGGHPLTPNIDATAEYGIWFERLYATGSRSARGIEAVLSGFTPTARSSTVKLMETQENFFTLASLLNRQGYHTSFIYGGEAHFDNMRRFFLNNGFQSVIDEKDFKNPDYMGTWGVSDGDLFNRAHEQFQQAGDQPFFSLVFTSSNHEPFDIPAGKVTPETGPNAGLHTAIKYADFALGEFIGQAKSSNYWDNTIFLIIADHDLRVYGNQIIPPERFHVPGVIIGGTIEPRRVPGITSQIDMVPTLLSLAGVSGEHPGLGRDLTQPEYRNGSDRAIMQFNRIAAFMVPGRVVAFQPDLPARSFLYEPGGKLEPDPDPDPALVRRALAYTWIAPLMIQNRWFYNTPD